MRTVYLRAKRKVSIKANIKLSPYATPPRHFVVILSQKTCLKSVQTAEEDSLNSQSLTIKPYNMKSAQYAFKLCMGARLNLIPVSNSNQKFAIYANRHSLARNL